MFKDIKGWFLEFLPILLIPTIGFFLLIYGLVNKGLIESKWLTFNLPFILAIIVISILSLYFIEVHAIKKIKSGEIINEKFTSIRKQIISLSTIIFYINVSIVMIKNNASTSGSLNINLYTMYVNVIYLALIILQIFVFYMWKKEYKSENKEELNKVFCTIQNSLLVLVLSGIFTYIL